MDPNRAMAKAQAALDGYHDVFGYPATRDVLLYMLCVAEHETHCGDDWVDEHKQPVHNWGAVQWRAPNAQEMQRINAGDLHKGGTIPGGILEQDSDPRIGQYWVFFRTFQSDRAGASFFASTLYKNDGPAHALAKKGLGPSPTAILEFCTDMYIHGYFGGFHPTPAERAAGKPMVRPYGQRKDPLNISEAENCSDYAAAVAKLWPEWVDALQGLPLVADVGQGQPDPVKPPQVDPTAAAPEANDPQAAHGDPTAVGA